MISLTVDMSDIGRTAAEMKTAPQWIPGMVDKELPRLGKKVVPIMRRQVRSNRYTGTLEDSIQSEYSSTEKSVEIGANANRGQFNAGLLLQEGTRPISNVPWKPILAWATRKGIDNSYFVKKKIKEEGVDAHPFLQETMDSPDFQNAMDEVARKLGDQIAARSISGGKTLGTATFESQ